MNYTVESINDCTKKLVFNFETIDLTAEIKKALGAKRRDTNMKGYRKGKAPAHLIEKMYGPQAEQEALSKFVQDQFFSAVKSEDLKAIGYPAFSNTKYKKGEGVSFDVVVEIFPSVNLGPLDKLSFTEETVSIENEEVQKVIEGYLNSKATTEEVIESGAKLEKGHTSVINFQGVTPDGSRPENMGGKEFLLEIGSNSFIPGFEDGLIGMMKGDKKNIDLTFPEDYHQDKLKSVKVTFEVELLEIKKKELPELTNELAVDFGFETVEDLRSKTRTRILEQKENETKTKLHQEILEKIVEENPFDIPQTLLTKQEEHVKEDLKKNLAQQGLKDDMISEYFEKWQDDIKSKAEFQVRTGLILENLAKEHKIEAREDDLNKKIDEMVNKGGASKEEIEKYYKQNKEVKQNIMYAIREEKTFDKIKELVNLAK